MPSEREHLLAALGIPHLQRPVQTAADDPPPVRAERHANEIIGVPPECERLLAALGIPHIERPTGAGNPPTVQAERYRADNAAVPPECERFLAALGIPQPNRVVNTATYDPPTLRTERHA